MNNYSLVRYIIELAVVILFMVLLGWIAFTWLFPGNFVPVLPYFLIFMVIITLAGQIILSRMTNTANLNKFNIRFMAYKAVKMLAVLAFLLGYLVNNKNSGISFLLSAFVIYLIFMGFEARALNRMVQSKRG